MERYPTWSYHLANDHKNGGDPGMSFVILFFVHKWYFELPYHLVSEGVFFLWLFGTKVKQKAILIK